MPLHGSTHTLQKQFQIMIDLIKSHEITNALLNNILLLLLKENIS